MGVQNKLSGRVENCVPRWFGHLERMAKMVYDLGVYGSRGRGRTTTVWMNGVKKALTNRGLTLEQARVTGHYIAEWRGLVKKA